MLHQLYQLPSLSETFSYRHTNSFKPIVADYAEGIEGLKQFFNYPVSIEGLNQAVHDRSNFPVDRKLLVEQLKTQYAQGNTSEKQHANIESLLSENTFTICTAHQPNIFTGHLYFIYKIFHVIKIADELNVSQSVNHFVPVYYMGSEDADLAELGHIELDGINHKWETLQTGAVGRMKVDKKLIDLIHLFSVQLKTFPHGTALIKLLLDCYKLNETIEQATFNLVNHLFAQNGLLVVLPDNPSFKRAFIPVIKKEIEEQFSIKALSGIRAAFPGQYPVQTSGRPINLFYLKDDRRERIEKVGNEFHVIDLDLSFSKESLLAELESFPERFSPNVILRPLLQESILPNVAFVGGGGEIAYWLELKDVFQSANVFLPPLIIRNSFLLVEKKEQVLLKKLKFNYADLFSSVQDLSAAFIKANSAQQLDLKEQRMSLNQLYHQAEKIAASIDVTLIAHIKSLQSAGDNKLAAVEKKMLRAEKRKFADAMQQIEKLKAVLFPHQNLQERVENFMWYYAKYGPTFLDGIYQHSLTLEQLFIVIPLEDRL